ncbi:fibronectin type III domain-containing protein [Fulvivirga sediminis]|uniref:Fibronectin type III domain-containing protein n=1 Tax=Fulvivirga sediminis TaxID=2803949 RepID=A0A937K0P9_9BACT|nr:fibronectin type III domain-containing protein [Fulvivirga sediminis]MBL3658568.1 fibronectin type III domain-containing protein [Fulvivirga sediminis]
MKKYIYFLIFIAGYFFSQQVVAQSYPVQATFQLTPPYSLYLSDYAAADNNRFALNVLLRDLSRQDLQVRLRLTIEGVGVSITTRPDYRPQPLFLQGGMPLMLGAADLGAYFNPENLLFQGISKDQVVRGNALPEGFYRICFEVLEYNLGTEVSNMACGSAWLMLNDPPIINTPFNGEKVRVQDPQTQLFQWTPRHTGSPNSAFSTAYDFELVELWPEGRDPNNAIQSTPPIYETTTYSTSLVYGIAEPPLVPGRRYAFRVRARAINGIEPMDLFKNDGYSEVYSFIYGDACSPPVVVEASTVSSSRIKVSWQTAPAQTEFVVYYRKEGSDDEWKSENTYLEEITLSGLQPETTYEFQVAALCGAYNGGKSGVVTSATSENPVTNYTCGAQPGDIDLENQEALPELNPGDIFKAGDVEVRVINASGSNGTFSGKGHAEMPWLKHVKVRVEFDGIFINTDLQMITGAVTTIFNADSPLMFDLDALGGDAAVEEGGDPEDQVAPFDGTTIKVDGTIASVKVDDAGNIVVEKDDGTTQTIAQETDPETGEKIPTQITDDEGNTYTVDKEGKVSKSSASGTPALEPGAEWDYLVKFDAYSRQNYGFDTKDQSVFTDYKRVIIDSADYDVPWKSMETGQIDYVNAILEGDQAFPEVIAFKSAIGGTLGTQPAEAENQKQVMLVGGMPESTQEVYAYVVQEDEEGNETEYTVGQLNMVSYTKERNTVVLVPVNGASIPGNIQQGINDIFKQGVAEWNVQIADSYTVDDKTLADLAVPESSGVLASFPSKMRQFNRRFKRSVNFDNQAYYLFVIDGDGGDRDGFMPFKRQYGYIWRKNGSVDLAAVVAHELSHGAFRLRHTFSSEAYVTGKGQTNGNLMDYPVGKSLRKYQWDYIHNPESMIGWFEDDQESEMEGDANSITLEELSFDNLFETNFEQGEDYAFSAPSGKLWKPTGNITNLKFNPTTGTLVEFEQDGKLYMALFYNGVNFGYYFDKSEYHRIRQQYGNRVTQTVLETPENSPYEFSAFTIASGSVTAYAEIFSTNDRYCGEKYTWISDITNAPVNLGGYHVTESIIPPQPPSQFIGYRECEARDRVVKGAGLFLFDALIANAATKEDVDDLVDYCNQVSAWGEESTSPASNMSTISLQDYLEENNVTSIKDLEKDFYIGPSKEGVILSKYNLWQDLDYDDSDGVSYNSLSIDYLKGGRYTYSYSDLKARYFLFNEAEFKGFEIAIREAESVGRAQPICAEDAARQYKKKYGINSAIFLAMEHYFMELPMMEIATGVSKIASGKMLMNADNFTNSYEIKKFLHEAKQFNKLNELVGDLSSNSKAFLNNTLQPSVTDRSVKLMLGSNDEIWMVASRGADEKLIASMTKSNGQDVLKIADEGWLDDLMSAGDDFISLGDEVKVLAANGDDLSGKVKVGQKNGSYYFVKISGEATSAGGSINDVVQRLKQFTSKYTEDEFIQLARKAGELGLDAKTTDDFIRIGDIKDFNSSELILQMDNWVSVVNKRGYPYGFNTLGDFNIFKSKVTSLLDQVGINTYDIRVQGSSLRKTTPKDIDIAIFLQQTDFNKIVENIRDNYRIINERAGKITKISKNFEKDLLKGKIASFHFDNLPDGRTFDKAKFQELGDVDISIIVEGEKLDLLPYLKF